MGDIFTSAFLLPVSVILIVRYMKYVMNGVGSNYTLWLGVSASVAGLFISVFAMAAFSWLGEVGRYGEDSYGVIVKSTMVWGVSPGFLCMVLTWKLMSIPRLKREVLLGDHDVGFNEPPRRAKTLSAQRDEIAALMRSRKSTDDLAKTRSNATADPHSPEVGDDNGALEDRRGDDKNKDRPHVVVYEPLGLALRKGATQGAVFGVLMCLLNLVPTLDLDRSELFPGAKPELRETLMKFAIYETLDLDLLDKWSRSEDGPAPASNDRLDAALSGFILDGHPTNRKFSESLWRFLELPMPSSTRASGVPDLDYLRGITALGIKLQLSAKAHRTAENCAEFARAHWSILWTFSDKKQTTVGPFNGSTRITDVVAACEFYFDKRMIIVRIQIFLTTFLVGFLLMIVCEIFNIGLKPEKVSDHRRIDTRETSLHQAFENTA